MSIIGQQIRKYRTAKGITQEQLGQLVGVTTQAVSKWECGGTPDAELLPKLSEVLNVSIDALFGREEQNFLLSLAQKICLMPNEEAYRYAFDICWAIMVGLMHRPLEDDPFTSVFINHEIIISENTSRYGQIMHDSGIATATVTPDFRNFFLMMEPESGLRAQLSDPESLRRVFALFADETLLKIIFYMYTRLNTPIATSLISKNTGLPIQQVDDCMAILCENSLATRTTIATSDGEIYSYMFNHESAVIALLCFADELARKESSPLLWSFNRTKPLFKSTDS
jgi:transcriptional regulator with XRE-family HTH domain